MCTKHCTILVVVAVALTFGLGYLVRAPIHLPVGSSPGCNASWYGFPFGFRPSPNCVDSLVRLTNFFVNGLLNVLLYFFPLRLLHDLLLHRKPKA